MRKGLTPLRTLSNRAAQAQSSIATLAGLLGRSGCSGLRVSAAEFFVEQDRFGDFFHGHAPLPAFALQGSISFFLAEAKIALQDALGSLDDLPRLQLLGKL